MRLMYTKFLSCLVISVVIDSFQETEAQNNTMFYMTNVPQVYFLNPATQPGCNLFLGLPLGSSNQFDVSNSAITYNDIYYKNSVTDSVDLFLQTTDGINKFISKLDNVNYFSVGSVNNILSAGFRSRKMYFTLDITSRLNNKIDYPKDFVSFMTLNIPGGSNFDLSSFNIDITEYIEIGLGISRKFGDQFSVGIRPKLLYGIGTISSDTHDLSISSDPITKNLTFAINSDLNVCIPGIIIPTDSSGAIDWNGDFKSEKNINTTSDYINLLTGNKGYGIDAGINFKPVERLELSASIIDLGYIKWKSYTHTYTAQGSYVYEGLVWDAKDSTITGKDIIDSLKSHFNFMGTESSFKTNLTPKLYIGGRYFVFQKFDLGALARIDFNKSDVKTNILFLADWRPISIWNISASYGLLDRSSSTFGLGMSFRLGTFNFYLASDDIPTTYNQIKGKSLNIPVPNDMLSYNLRFGFNLVFGNSERKKLKKDKPMYFSSEY